jgi:hypothetical protein
MPPGDVHTSMRSLLHKGLAPRVVRDEKEYDAIIQHAIQDVLLVKLKNFEGDPSEIVGRWVIIVREVDEATNSTASRTMSDILIDITYGDAIKTPEERDKLVEANKEAVGLTAGAFTSLWAVDLLPFRE